MPTSTHIKVTALAFTGMGRHLRMLQAARKHKSDDKPALLVSVINYKEVSHMFDIMC
jgi:hypothetical protein